MIDYSSISYPVSRPINLNLNYRKILELSAEVLTVAGLFTAGFIWLLALPTII
mgnify:CR=1 FL=1